MKLTESTYDASHLFAHFHNNTHGSVENDWGQVTGDVKKQHQDLVNVSPKVSKDDAETISNYTSFGAMDVNRLLINGGNHHDARWEINAFKAAAHPLKEDMHTYSGLGHYDPSAHISNQGLIHFPAFTSTSLHPRPASVFTTEYAFNHIIKHGGEHPGIVMTKDGSLKANDSHIIHFHLPAGYNKGSYVAHHSTSGEEYEYVLHPGQVWKVHGQDKYNLNSGAKLHVWHMKPHENLNETFSHPNDEYFTKHFIPEKNKIAHSYADEYTWNTAIGPFKTHEWEHPDVIKQHEMLEKLHTPHLDSREHLSIIREYISGGSYHINHNLLGGFEDVAARQMDKIYEGLPPLDHEVHSYSAVGFDPEHKLKEGKFHSPAFLSTSINPHIAHNVAPEAAQYGTSHIIHFALPKGYKHAAYVASSDFNHGYSHQRELIIKRNTKWNLTKGQRITSGTLDGNERPIDVQFWHATPAEEDLKESFARDVFADRKAHDTIEDAFADRKSTAIEEILTSQDVRRLHHDILSHIGDPTREDVYNIRGFTTGHSAEINRRLFNGEKLPPLLKKVHDDITSHVANSIKYDKPLDVYSGMGGYDPTDHLNGGIFRNAGWLSASINPHVASMRNNFHQLLKNATNDHIIHFTIPPNYEHGSYIAHASTFPIEREYLIKPDQKWVVLGKEVVGGRTLWRVKPHENLNEAWKHNALYDHKSNLDPSDLDWGYPTSNKKYEDEHKHLTTLHASEDPAEIDAANAYAHDSGWAQNPESTYYQRYNEHLMRFLSNAAPLTREHHVYSGMGHYCPETTKNGIFKIDRHISASINPEISAIHSNGRSVSSEPIHTLHFHLPVGYKGGRYIAPYSDYPQELEYVLKSNQKFRMTGADTVSMFDEHGYRKPIVVWHAVPHEDLNEAANFDALEDDRIGDHDGWKEATDLHHEMISKRTPLTDHEENILKKYKDGSHSYDINRGLIHGLDNEEHNHEVGNLDNIIKKAAPLHKDIDVYSGTGQWQPIIEGGIIHTPAFTSTTLAPRKARLFAVPNNTILHFALPAGFKHGFYVEHPNESHAGEMEYLLARGLKWKHVATNGITMRHHFAGKFTPAAKKLVIHTLVPHEDSLKEAYDYDPERFVLNNPDLRSKVAPDADKLHRELSHRHSWEMYGTDHHFDTIKHYAQRSRNVNMALIDVHRDPSRHELHSHYLQHADDISNAIKHLSKPLPTDIHVFSGTLGWDPSLSLKNGILHTPAFTSTSISEAVSRYFAPKHGEDAYRNIIHFHLPKGFDGGHYLPSDNQDNPFEEMEYLLDKGQNWKYVKKDVVHRKPLKNINITYHIHTLVPHEEPLKEATYHDSSLFQTHPPNSKRMEHAKDASKQHALLTAHFNDASTDARNSFSYYKGSSSSINRTLVGHLKIPHDDHYLQTANTLSHHLKTTGEGLPTDTHVYSGVGSWIGAAVRTAIRHHGGIVHTPAFTSASLNADTARWFANYGSFADNPQSGSHIIHFHLPQGFMRGVYIDSDNIRGRDWSNFEKEYLLDKDQKWKFVKHELVAKASPTSKDIHIWTLIPHEDTPTK